MLWEPREYTAEEAEEFKELTRLSEIEAASLPKDIWYKHIRYLRQKEAYENVMKTRSEYREEVKPELHSFIGRSWNKPKDG